MKVYSQAYQQDLQGQEAQFLQAYPKIKHIKKWKKIFCIFAFMYKSCFLKPRLQIVPTPNF